MRVLICDPVAPETIQAMQEAGIEVDNRSDITTEELLRDIAAYDGMVVRSRTKVGADVLDAADNLKIIVRGGVGLDSIDVAHAKSKGIEVRNTPKASSNSVAELALGYMLAMARKIPQATASMTAGEWKKKQLKGSEISGKTLGLIGYGNIGGLLGKKASALGMNVIFYDVITPPDTGDAEQVSLDEVLTQSDFISLHVPKLPATTNMLNAEAFAKMKDGVFLVNCARGGIVDEDALYDALESGKVAGAALDVFLDEKVNPGNPKLFELKDENGFNRVIGSPHIGASTVEGQIRVGTEVADILIEFYNKNR
jgi:D-3-phosphoglycerate dehydrogenase